MMKIYSTVDSLKKDLPKLKDITINVWEDFDKTTKILNTWEYKSLKAQLKRQNIKIIIVKKGDIYGN